MRLRLRLRLRDQACKLRRTTQQCALCVNGHEAMTGSKARHQGPRIVMRRSGIHGRGVFALADIAKGTRLIEYLGERITKDVKARWPCWCGASECRGTVLVPTPKPRKKATRRAG